MMGLLFQDFLGRVLGAWGGNIGGASKYGTERGYRLRRLEGKGAL